MQSRTQFTPSHWYNTALEHVLLRHSQSFNEEESKEVLNLYMAANELTATPLDHLEILRLFESVLSKHITFETDKRTLSTLDLFYASLVTGLKIAIEAHPYEITLDEIQSKLPDHSHYVQVDIDTAAIERAFLNNINWQIQTLPDTAFDDYIKLLAPLDGDTLNQLSAIVLLIASTDFSPENTLHKVLCELDPLLEAKALSVSTKLKSTPLLYAFIDDNVARLNLTNEIYDYLHTNQAPFEFSENTHEIICKSIRSYFVNRNRVPSLMEEKALLDYFTPDQVNRIGIQNQWNRLQSLKSQSIQNIESQRNQTLQKMMDDLNLEQIKKAWLEPILLPLEALDKTSDLTAEIITTVLTDREKSVFILDIYSTLHTEGWLSVINTSRELRKNIAETIFNGRNTTTSDLMTSVKSAIKIHFILNTPTMSTLTLMSKMKNPSEENVTLVNHITLTYYTHLKKGLLERFNDLSINAENHFAQLDHHFSTYPIARLGLASALNFIKTKMRTFDPSISLAILERPEQCRFRAILTQRIQEAFAAYYGLYEAQYKLPNLYALVFERIDRDTALMMDIELFFFMIHRRSATDSSFTLNALPGVKTHLRAVLDAAVNNGSLDLMDDEKKDLSDFYETYKIRTPVSAPQGSPSPRLFAPKPIRGNLLEASIATPLTSPSPSP